MIDTGNIRNADNFIYIGNIRNTGNFNHVGNISNTANFHNIGNITNASNFINIGNTEIEVILEILVVSEMPLTQYYLQYQKCW